jgi:uncharacterized membrane protein HdeD (DUF308 family)
MLIEIVALILAVPAGFLIAYLANDELVQGRAWFKLIAILSLIAGIWMFFTGERVITWTCGFIVIVSGVSYLKSFDKNWVKRRIS